MKIPFNRPPIFGDEGKYLQEVLNTGHISGNGEFTGRCHKFFDEQYSGSKCLLTNSCTAALEMSAILANIKAGDEVILPAFTFVSTANAFLLRGASLVFVDSSPANPNIDPSKIEEKISERTKAIVVVHYAGIACDMNAILHLAKKYDLVVIEDAAQGVDSFYKGKRLGSIGTFGTLSFHETKNISSGEGGLLIVNDRNFSHRAEVIWEKGTNRIDFKRGLVNKYEWIDLGSSFLPADLTAAYLLSQLNRFEVIQKQRREIWERYYANLAGAQEKGYITLNQIPDYATNNGHMFYILCNNHSDRQDLLKYLQSNGVLAVFHYLTLSESPYYRTISKKRYDVPNALRYEQTLIRLPLFFDLEEEQQDFITDLIYQYFEG